MEMFSIGARLLLATVFAVAGFAKLRDRAGSIRSMSDFGLPQPLATPAAFVLPLVELLCAVALISSRTAQWGALGVLLMLTVFIVAIAISLARGRRPDCRCFGQLHSEPVGWNTVIRNLALAAVAGLVIWHGSQAPHASLLNLLGTATAAGPVAMMTVAGISAFLAALALLLSVQLLRQNGRLLIRLEAVEAKVGLTAATMISGLPLDSAAPKFGLSDLDGGTVTLDALGADGKPLLLVFTEPGCSACDVLLPEVGRWQREHAERLTTVVISRGTVAQNQDKRKEHGLQQLLVQINGEVADAFRVVATPSAVVVKNGRIAHATVAGADAIRDLATDLVAVRARKGDPAPAFLLKDLHGSSITLDSLRGRRTLILFWDPACGFCQQMLDEVKAWELGASAAAPQLLVLSTGSAAVNEQQGFRSRIALDPEFRVGPMFGVAGTPSAVVIDEQGRVASDVVVGRPEILELAKR